MKLDRPGAPHEAPLAPEDWMMIILREGDQHIAELRRDDQVMCRLSVALNEQDEDAARTAVAEKARWWIHEYLSRPPTSSVDPE